jgi:threonine dehydratase
MFRISYNSITNARDIISKHLKVTPLTYSERLSVKYKKDIYIKWENKHRTGSFKERGACYFLSKLDPSKIKQVYAYSAGNHALAISHHAKKFNIPCSIVMPKFAPLVKVRATQLNGANVILHGDTFDQAKLHALDTFGNDPLNIVLPAFDHEEVVTGQGTCGLEILDQLDDCDSIFVPVGGGGLISGIASAVKAKKPSIKIIAVQSEWAHVHRNMDAKTKNNFLATIADGIAVKQLGEVTKDIISNLVDDTITVSEQEIADGINHLLTYEHTLSEGAGVAALALLFAERIPSQYKKPLFVMTGSNIDLNLLGRLIERHMAQASRLLKVKVALPDRPGSLHRLTGIIAKANGNVLRVVHDRSFCEQPGCVQIGFVLEVQDEEHSKLILNTLQQEGLETELF